MSKKENKVTEEEFRLKMIQLEEKKFRTEKIKNIFSVLSILIPLIVIAISVFNTNKAQSIQNEINFQLKAAEIIFNTNSPDEALGKAEMLSALFEGNLPKDFAKSINPEKYTNDSPDAELVLKVLGLLSKYPEKRNEILSSWLSIYEGDVWVETLMGSEKDITN